MKLNFRWLDFGAVIKVIAIFCCSIVCHELTAGEGLEMRNQIVDPVYRLKIDTFGVRYYLNINNVTVLEQLASDTQLATTISINQWMTPSENEFSLDLIPDDVGEKFNPASRFNMSLEVISNSDHNLNLIIPLVEFSGDYNLEEIKELGGAPQGRYSVSNDFAKADNGAIEIKAGTLIQVQEFEGAYTYSKIIVLPSTLPKWKFLGSKNLPDYYSLNDQQYSAALKDIYSIYESVQLALKQGNVEFVADLFSERNEEMDKAYYLEKGETQKKLLESLREDLGNESKELVDLSPEMLAITLEDNQKLVSLTRNEGKAAIAFNLEGGGATYYDFKLRYEDGQWIVSR